MFFYISIAAFAILFLYYRLVYSRFDKYGVKCYRPLPLVGNFGPVVIRKKFFGNVIADMYYGFPGQKFVGYYEFVTPTILVRDIELLKKIAIQDFESFFDHRVYISEEVDPIFGRTVFVLRGDDWKNMRSKLSPAFTSAKMKQMLPVMSEIGSQLTSSLVKQIRKSKNDYLDIDMKDLSIRFANDISAYCAFGLKVDSISDPDNEFFKDCSKSSHFSSWDLLKFLGYNSMPSVMKFFKISFLTRETKEFFVNFVLNTMKDREKHNIVRPDLIQILMECRTDWIDNDLIAQVFIFVVASYETISTTLSFLFYELAANPHIQERLVQEILKYKEMTGGKFDYNTLQTMPYLDMVLSETLRLWPPAVVTDRICTKEYNLGRPNDEATEDFIIKVGEDVIIPILAIHRDPQYFKDPLKFDPERFSDNKHKIKPFTYIPFGLGPRHCIGNKLAVLGMKVLVAHLLPQMEILPCSKTTSPPELSAETFTLKFKGGHWLKFKARN